MRISLLTLLWLVISPAFGNNQLPPVATVIASQQPIYRQLLLTGTVTSPKVARLSVATSGLIETMAADAGDKVSQGDILLQMDDDLATHQLQVARAMNEQARLAHEDALRRLREAQRLLLQKGIAESAVKDLEAEVIQDQASLQAAEAEQNRQAGIVSRHQLPAPFDGVISQKLSEVGEWVSPGTGVYELVATDGLRLDLTAPETYLNQLLPGEPLRYRISSHPETQFTGTITTIVPVTAPGNRTFLVRAEPTDVPEGLFPGMSVSAAINVDSGRTSVTVPRDAVMKMPDGRTVVWSVENRDDAWVAVENVVRTGLSFSGVTEISSGLASGSRVVTQGNEALQTGQAVRLLETSATEN